MPAVVPSLGRRSPTPASPSTPPRIIPGKRAPESPTQEVLEIDFSTMRRRFVPPAPTRATILVRRLRVRRPGQKSATSPGRVLRPPNGRSASSRTRPPARTCHDLNAGGHPEVSCPGFR
jgi:hypothetical protein